MKLLELLNIFMSVTLVVSRTTHVKIAELHNDGHQLVARASSRGSRSSSTSRISSPIGSRGSSPVQRVPEAPVLGSTRRGTGTSGVQGGSPPRPRTLWASNASPDTIRDARIGSVQPATVSPYAISPQGRSASSTIRPVSPNRAPGQPARAWAFTRREGEVMKGSDGRNAINVQHSYRSYTNGNGFRKTEGHMLSMAGKFSAHGPGGSGAQGLHSVRTMVNNFPGTSANIMIEKPGSPTRFVHVPDGESRDFTFDRNRPHLGQIRTTTSQNGPGSTTSIGMN